MEQRDELAEVKRRLTRKFRGEWMDDIYPGLGFREQRLAFGHDLLALGLAVIEAEAPPNQCEDPTPAEPTVPWGGHLIGLTNGKCVRCGEANQRIYSHPHITCRLEAEARHPGPDRVPHGRGRGAGGQ
jgi:hypothetical protein